jgi:pimeloyl-ACP methyl ester carboxylesterase
VSGPEFLNVDAGEVRLRVAVQGSGPLVLMVHGFPESWYSWRHQLGPWRKRASRRRR